MTLLDIKLDIKSISQRVLIALGTSVTLAVFGFQIINLPVFADSKTDALSAYQIAQLQAQLAAVNKTNLALSASLKRQAQALDTLNSGMQSGKITQSLIRQSTSETVQATQEATKQAEDRAEKAKLQSTQLLASAQSQQWITYGILATQAFGFLTLIAGFVWKFIEDGRQHAWAKESAAVSMSKLDEVKNSADAAFHEANTVNNKIADIGMKMKDNKLL